MFPICAVYTHEIYILNLVNYALFVRPLALARRLEKKRYRAKNKEGRWELEDNIVLDMKVKTDTVHQVGEKNSKENQNY